MLYDPRQPHDERYVQNADPTDIAPLPERLSKDCLTLCRALGYDMNTVEFAVRDGIPYAIDFLNPAPDADRVSVGEANFEWIVENDGGPRHQKSLDDAAPQSDYHWGRFLAGGRKRRTMADRPSFTIGIEEEYMTIDPATRELRSHIEAEIIEQGQARCCAERVKPEMHQCVVEVGTGICRNIKEARAESVEIRRQHGRTGQGERPATGGRGAPIHFPTGANRASIPTPGITRSSRTCKIVARANLIFGLHVHVGDRGPGDRDPHHERGALLSAAYPGALHQLAILAGR